MKNKKSEFACIVSLCIFIVLSLTEILVKFIWKSAVPSWMPWVYCVLELIILLVPGIILCKAQKLAPKRFFNLRPFRLSWLPVTVFGAVTATLGAVLLNLLLYSLPFSSVFKSSPSIGTDADKVALFLLTVLIPAIFEELYIHGAVMSMLRKRSIRSAVLITALIFAMLHSSGANFLGPFFAAVIYGYLTVCYASVWPAVIAHFINNLLADFMNLFVQRYVNIGINGYIIVFVLLLFLVSLWFFCTLLQKQVKKIRVSTAPHSETEVGFPISLGIFVLCWAAKLTFSLLGLI